MVVEFDTFDGTSSNGPGPLCGLRRRIFGILATCNSLWRAVGVSPPATGGSNAEGLTSTTRLLSSRPKTSPINRQPKVCEPDNARPHAYVCGLRLTDRELAPFKNVPDITGTGRPSRPLLERVLLLVVILLLTIDLPTLLAQQDFIDRTPKIKAAYLYNFGKYVEWRPEAMRFTHENRPVFVIGVVGDSPVLDPLHQIARTKKLHEHGILIRYLGTVRDYQPCHILFFPAGLDPNVGNAILDHVRNNQTLTVGETDGFAQNGGMINFYIEENRVKFEINQEQAKKAGVSISSRLLRLGRIVRAD